MFQIKKNKTIQNTIQPMKNPLAPSPNAISNFQNIASFESYTGSSIAAKQTKL